MPNAKTALPAKFVKKHSDIDGLEITQPYKDAMRLVLDGETYQTSAELCGMKDHRHLYRLCKRHGITRIHDVNRRLRENPDALIQQHKQNAMMGAEALGDRLEADPDSISVMELNVIAGTATDKVAVKERWGKGNDDDLNDRIDKFGQFLLKLNAGVKITLEVEPHSARPEIEPESKISSPITLDIKPVESSDNPPT